MIVLVMGVCGAGKTTIGRALAQALGARFIEGDDFHGAANREKMRGGQPLDDADRAGWLAALALELAAARAAGERAVLACSALKGAYRDILAAACPELRVVWLEGGREVIAGRLAQRRDHFMPPGLLDSQYAILEPPRGALVVDVAFPPDAIVADLVRRLAISEGS